ncbi:MAG: metal ABC transporter permease [Hyphomonadaceae bacterium]|nr:metal ABC transporter permease [Hyphomonadaceae bacterium]
MGLIEALIALFSYDFLLRALAGGVAVAIAAAPIGVFLTLRKMSLAGDAVGHAIVPGAAAAALISGGTTWAVTLGAALTGSLVFALAGISSRLLRLPEDAGVALFYLGALAAGVLIARAGPVPVDLEQLLFGAALSLDATALLVAAGAATFSVVTIALIYRPLLLDTIDPGAGFAGPGGRLAVVSLFHAALALTAVAAFHVVGALMAVGLLVLPAIAARFWARSVPGMIGAAMLAGVTGVGCGLVLSLTADLPAGAAIVCALVVLALGSALLGPVGSLYSRSIIGARHAAVAP